MVRRKRTFAGELTYFAESIDIVDDSTLREVRELVWRYLKDQLQAEYFEIMYRTSINKQAALKSHWSSRDDVTWSVRDGGTYTNPIVQAYDANAAMWLVSPSGSPLAEAEKLEDQWSGTTSLPPYRPLLVGRPIKTVVVIPISRPSGYGVFFLETRERVDATEVAKEELMALAHAIGIFLELNALNRRQAELTREAIRELREIVEAAEFPKLALPRLFFAFSDRGDRAVISAVKRVLATFDGKIELRDWDEMREAGNIPTQITHSITRSKFGICYLSEPRDGSSGQDGYIDNPNVVFESGMLQAQTSAYMSEGEATGWIPIRERNSPQAPFDFASERMLIVPRNATGQLDELKLRDELDRRVRGLLRA